MVMESCGVQFLQSCLGLQYFDKKKRAINQLIAECLQTYEVLARYEIYKLIKQKTFTIICQFKG